MSNIFIHYFTGTGNTAHAVKIIGEQLQSAGHHINVIKVRKGITPSHDKADYHIVAFPVLSWAAPTLMKHYLSKMPVSNGTKVAVLAVSGSIFSNGKIVKGYAGQALEEVESLLKRRKYDVFLTGNASFPDNWTQVTNPCTKEESESIFHLAEAEVEVFIQKFIAGKRELYRCGFFNLLWSKATALLFGLIGRRALGKFFIADEHCTGCTLCAKACPVQTIHMDDKKPHWDTRCEDCNRCINICPENAIQVSMPMFILQMTIHVFVTIWVIHQILRYIPEWVQLEEFLTIGIEVVLIVVAYIILLWISFVPLDWILRQFLQFRSVRRFFSLSYTQSYRRYKAPGFNPLKENG
ncbi:MAG TPA: EFR1 family ferrodoxin [Bacteroidales bacterium]|nr:EFR1 family ferrodoxin [Bacteroidales bacterium]